jgi:hypothetical protein
MCLFRFVGVTPGGAQGGAMGSGNHKIPANNLLEYGEEVLCANWNPLALLVAEPVASAQATGVDGSDAEAFLARLYRCQQA